MGDISFIHNKILGSDLVTIKTAAQRQVALAGNTFIVNVVGPADGEIYYDSSTKKLYVASATAIDLSDASDTAFEVVIAGIFGAVEATDEITFGDDLSAAIIVKNITFKAASKDATKISNALSLTAELTLAVNAAVAADLTIGSGKKLTILNTIVVTLSGGAKIIAGGLTITTNGTLVVERAAVTIDENGIKGATSATKLVSNAPIITLGTNNTGSATTFAAAFDSVDVYLKASTASVVVTSSNLANSVATLTLKNDARISGLTGPVSLSPVTPLSGGTLWAGTGKVATGLSAVAPAGGGPFAVNCIEQTTAGTPGTFAVTTQSNNTALDITIVIATVASPTGA
ncbi:hypothetical protein FACS1894172_19480 [Spirochaetia bacterium]|nr:hypothetical protein FACS1894172_19480 [Spirochaetia bacterium]